MPNDLDRYTELLQNLAVSIGAIREAIEQAFGVTLPTATTLNAEFEIITTAIYSAADRPRPAPVAEATYRPGEGSRAGLMLDPGFAAAFTAAKERIRVMEYRYVEEADATYRAVV